MTDLATETLNSLAQISDTNTMIGKYTNHHKKNVYINFV